MQVATPSSTAPFTISPSFSHLHPPSIQHNNLILSNLSTLTAIFAGSLSGILGLKNFYGFGFYLISSLFSALVVVAIKGNGRIGNYVPGLYDDMSKDVQRGFGWKVLWQLMNVGQDTGLTFMLLWIGMYAIIHVYD